MAKVHGITANTYRRLVIDAGQVRVGYTDQSSTGLLIGATRGGSTFSVEPEVKDMPVDGAPGRVMGGSRITKVAARLEVNFIEFTKELIEMALPGATTTDWPDSVPTHDEIRRAIEIALTDYKTNVVLIGEISGSGQPIICGIENVLAIGNFQIAATDKEEHPLKVTFEAHFDPADLETEPWFIRFPKDVATTEGA